MFAVLIIAAALFAVEAPQPSAASETPPVGRPVVITNPDWVRKPTAADLSGFYPDRARRLNRSGFVILLCDVQNDGQMGVCEVISENPPDNQFGEAALKLSRLFQMGPNPDAACHPHCKVRIPVVFAMEDDPPPPVDVIAPLSFDEAVMCHTLYKRQNRDGGLPHDKRMEANARALAVSLGAAQNVSLRDVERRLREDIKDGSYIPWAILRCQVIG